MDSKKQLELDVADFHRLPRPEPPDPMIQKRSNLIRKRREEAMQKPNTLAANLGCINADLHEQQLALSTLVKKLLSPESISISTLGDSAQALDLSMRLTKNIVQITQLELRMEKSAVHTPPNQPR